MAWLESCSTHLGKHLGNPLCQHEDSRFVWQQWALSRHCFLLLRLVPEFPVWILYIFWSSLEGSFLPVDLLYTDQKVTSVQSLSRVWLFATPWTAKSNIKKPKSPGHPPPVICPFRACAFGNLRLHLSVCGWPHPSAHTSSPSSVLETSTKSQQHLLPALSLQTSFLYFFSSPESVYKSYLLALLP